MEWLVMLGINLVMVMGEGGNGNSVVTGIRQFNPKCEMLDGFLKEECEQNREYKGLSGVPWWTWLVLGLVLGLILLVVARMLCASWKGREEEEKKRQKREESRQKKLERELRKTEERNHKKSVQVPEQEFSDGSEDYDGYHVPSISFQQNSEFSQLNSESVRGQVAGPSSLLFPTYEQINEGRAPVPYAQFRNADRTSVYV
eukprot:GFUD01014706.1.p1 GENE.GFUD01014706.1~~GFUD01014706.1.p1  ORF type:complete len:201 (+),score=39.70 GFUD01014706.1:22-624(+)